MRFKIEPDRENDFGKNWQLSFALWPRRVEGYFIWLEWYEYYLDMYDDGHKYKFKHNYRLVKINKE